MLLPFSERGKRWESVGQELRALAQLRPHDQLDPWILAPKVGLTVIDLFKILNIEEEDRSVLLQNGAASWSGGVYPNPLPDGSYICILNPSHSPRRNKITLMEEIIHSFLKHKPTTVMLTEMGVKVRDFNKSLEEEAYGIGAAALIPWSNFFTLLNRGYNVAELAEHYDVTQDLIVYRIKITGASRLYKARQRKKAKGSKPVLGVIKPSKSGVDL